MKNIEDYLSNYKLEAGKYLNDNIQINFQEYFQKFFKKEYLEKAEWSDFQNMSDHIHSINSMPLAKEEAFENPNLDIEYCRNIFLNLLYGKDDLSVRIQAFMESNVIQSKYFGNEAKSEIIAQAFPEDYMMFNYRNEFAMNLLGINSDDYSADTFYKTFIKYNELILPIKEKYLSIVGHLSTIPVNLELDRFFNYLYDKYLNDVEKISSKINYWQISPGNRGRLWDDCLKKGIIRLGYDKVHDLTNVKSKDEFERAYKESYGRDNPWDSGMLWSFFKEVKTGDYIIANRGKSMIMGIGIVDEDDRYYYDSSLSEYRHYKKVNWLKDFLPFEIEVNHRFSRTLLELSKDDYDSLIKSAKTVITEPSFDVTSKEQNYYWINANPKIWDLNSIKVGERQSYTALNEKGHKRNRYKCFQMVKPGDILIGYISTPIKEISAICRITKELHESEDEGLIFEFEKTEQLTNSISYSELQRIPGLKNCEPIINNQGSLFSLTQEEYEIIREIIDEKNIGIKAVPKPYSREDALKDLFIPEMDFDEIVDLLLYKKNIILQGPPGVGKTFIAKKIAYSILGQIDDSKIEMIQFHQSYSYEDFIQGFRPNEDGKFDLVNGIFYDFCRRAQRDKNNKYFFIIDEINRGNLSKIFGELMMLIEHDKRGIKYSISLTYSRSNDEKFFVPENLFIIGTMNTADRSLAFVDYALRRRFSFITLRPVFDDKLRTYLKEIKVDESVIDKIIQHINILNNVISNDKKNLGEGFQIGHSFFCTYNNFNSIGAEQWYKKVIKSEIAPLLKEYWFDDEDFAQKKIDELLY